MGFLNILGLAKIHKISKIWENWVPTVREKYGKHKHFQVKGFLNFSYEAEIYAFLETCEK